MSPDRDRFPDERPDLPDPDVDAAFAQIVAGWDEVAVLPDRDVLREDRTDEQGSGDVGPSAPAAGPPPATAAAPDLAAGADAAPAPLPVPPPVIPPTPAPSTSGPPTSGPPTSGPPTSGPRDWTAAEEVEEGFVPPVPPPLPRGDLVGRLAWAGVVLGPVFLLLCAVLWKETGRLWLGLAALAFVAGFVTLVLRLPTSHDDADDDGAVV